MLKNLTIVIISLLLLSLAACDSKPKTTTEKVKESVHNAADATKEAAHDAGVATKEAAHDIKHDVKKAAE